MTRNLRLWSMLAMCFAVATSALAQEASFQIVPLTQDAVEVKGADALGRPPSGSALRPDYAPRAFDPQLPAEVEPNATSATANALVNNLLGRTGMAIAPAVVGALSAWLGSVGQAVALVALVPLLCLPVILYAVSESRGQELERLSD